MLIIHLQKKFSEIPLLLKIFISFFFGKICLICNYYLIWPLYWNLIGITDSCDQPLLWIYLWISVIILSIVTILIQVIIQPTHTTALIAHFYMIMSGMGFLNYLAFTVSQVCYWGQIVLVSCPYWKEKYFGPTIGYFFTGCVFFIMEFSIFVFIFTKWLALEDLDNYDETLSENYDNLESIQVRQYTESYDLILQQ